LGLDTAVSAAGRPRCPGAHREGAVPCLDAGDPLLDRRLFRFDDFRGKEAVAAAVPVEGTRLAVFELDEDDEDVVLFLILGEPCRGRVFTEAG